MSNFAVLAEAQQILGIKDALAKLEMHQDKVENTKIWFSPYTEKCEETGQSVVALCIGMKENINMPMLMMSMEYIGDKDLRMNAIKIRAGDNKFTYNSGAFEKIERGNIKINNIEKYAERGTTWVEEFDIDGLRLDVAYCLDHDFLRRLRSFCDSLKPDFFLVGETLHGDYNQWMNDSMLHSVTNYECYKGLYSSFNSMNMFEINHSLLRQFGPDNWTLYKGKHLLCFVDNHDVTRIASILTNEKHLPLIYGMLFGMPGIPCVYYGSEWGAKARKEEGDQALRACFDAPEWNDLSETISRLSEIKKNSEALNYGSFRSVLLTNRQCIFERKSEHERIYVAINADENSFHADFDAGCGTAQELITDTPHDFGGGTDLPGYSVAIWKMEH